MFDDITSGILADATTMFYNPNHDFKKANIRPWTISQVEWARHHKKLNTQHHKYMPHKSVKVWGDQPMVFVDQAKLSGKFSVVMEGTHHIYQAIFSYITMLNTPQYTRGEVLTHTSSIIKKLFFTLKSQ